MSRPSLIVPERVESGRRLYLKGLGTNLKANDPLSPGPLGPGVIPLLIQEVTPDPSNDRTAVMVREWPTAEAKRTPEEIVRRYLGLNELYGDDNVLSPHVPLDTQIGQRVASTLAPLLTPRSQAATAEATSPLDDALARLREENRLAQDGKYPRLGPWLSGLLAELEGLRGGLGRARGAEPASVLAGRVPSEARLGTVIGQLEVPPSTPVARDARDLVLSLQDQFGGRLDASARALVALRPMDASARALVALRPMDASARALVALRPALRDSLYPALDHHLASPPTETSDRARTLRVKAAPFGSTAPPKLVPGAGGGITGTVEWPIRPLSVGVVFHADGLGQGLPDKENHLKNLKVEVTVERGGEIRHVTVPPPNIAGSSPSPTVLAPFPDPALTPPDGLLATLDATYDPYSVKSLTLNLKLKGSTGPLLMTIVVKPQPGPRYEYEVTIDNDRPPSVVVGGPIVVSSTAARQVMLSAPGLADFLNIKVDAVDSSTGDDFFKTLPLDAQYDQIVPGGYVLIERPTLPPQLAPQVQPLDVERPALPPESAPQVQPLDFYQVVRARTVSRCEYGITAKVTELLLDRPWLTALDRSLATLRGTTIYAQDDPLELAKEPLDADIEGDQIELDGIYDGLEAGRWLIVAGERTDVPGTSGVRAAELIMLARAEQSDQTLVPQIDAFQLSEFPELVISPEKGSLPLGGDSRHTVLHLANPLAYSYKRDTVAVYGNVVGATHGETRNEVLGGGDGSQALQQFALKQAPLTYVAAPTTSGVASTLKVYVNDVKWHETPRMDQLAPTDHGFVTQTDDNDQVNVIFGDGQHGARLPTGQNNVRTEYRFGIGKPGNVKAEQISQLATRPLHVQGVINPLAASGGADRESRDQARRNAPVGISALDRLVSLDDYADFARAFAGIAKAAAVRLPDGRRQIVHLTVAGIGDAPIDPTSDLYLNLRRALARFGDPALPVRVESRELRLLVLSAGVRRDPDHLWEPLADAVRAALLDAFGFDRRELGQDALLGEVIAVVQTVPGVVSVDVDVFGAIPTDDPIAPPGTTPPLTPEAISRMVQQLVEDQQAGVSRRVPIARASSQDGVIRPAQIGYLSPDLPATLVLREITS